MFWKDSSHGGFLVASSALALALALATSARAGDGVVALQTAAPSCADNSGEIYVDCFNGTVTDNRNGLVWLKDANCLTGPVVFSTAMEFVAGLSDAVSAAATDDCGLADGSSPGEWRLPSPEEWETMVADALGLSCTGGNAPSITSDDGLACWSVGPTSFSGVASSFYWSPTTSVSNPANAWVVNLVDGSVISGGIKSTSAYVWPVRGGQ